MLPIEFGRSPGYGRVTSRAVRPKATLMRLIVLVTGKAILRCHCEISQTARVDMTLHAGNARMLPGQLERKDIMAEMLPKAIHAVVTIKTGRTKRQCMRRHEPRVQLAVTGIAGVQYKGRDVALMTVITLERLLRNRTLVTV